MIGKVIKIKPEIARIRTRKRKVPLWRRRWFQVSCGLLVLASLSAWIALQIYIKQFKDRANSFDLTQMRDFEVSTLIYDRHGKEIGELADENRRPVSLDDIPFHFIQALSAAEDGRFFEHEGVDYIGIGRAVLSRFKKGKFTQGASTITQQLARQSYGQKDRSMLEKSVERKITEIFLAKRIEEQFTKAEILEMYLNRIYFGNRCWGISAASLKYFGKPVSELDLNESATICGLIKSPDRFSPIKDLAAALRERNYVLNRMVDEHYISVAEAERIKVEPIKLNPSLAARNGGYMIDLVNQEVGPLLEEFGYDDIVGEGLRIHTSLDADLQKVAEDSVKRRLNEIEQLPEYTAWIEEINKREDRKDRPRYRYADYVKDYERWRTAVQNGTLPGYSSPPEPEYLQSAVTVLDNRTGDIVAIVGGRDWVHNKINLATARPGRAPGTAFFPFVYGAAFEDKMFPGTRLSDDPLDNSRIMVGGLEGTLGEWGREGQTGPYHLGKITARAALVQSMNGASGRLGLDTGIEKIKAFAERAGFPEVNPIPASILGTSETSVRELALAYTTFPNGGKRPAETRLVTKITDAKGRVLWERPPVVMLPVTDEATAFMITSCLQDAIAVGTGSPSREYQLNENIPCAGKSGTHYEFRELWFAGYTSELTCAVWTGLRGRPETIFPGAYGSRCALPIWVDIINATTAKYPAKEFLAPAKIELAELCASSGLRATDRCYEVQEDPTTKRRYNVRTTYKEYIRPGFKLTQTCDVHSSAEDATLQIATKPLLVAPSANAANPTGINPIPVALKAPTVIGNDPYQAVQPNVTPPPAAVPKATSAQPPPVLLETPDLKKPQVNVPEPPPIKIE